RPARFRLERIRARSALVFLCLSSRQRRGRTAMERRQARRLLALVAGASVVAGSIAAAAGTAGRAASGWRIVPRPAIAWGELIGVAALGPSDAWAVGDRFVNGVFRPLAERWNGAAWSSVAIPAQGSFDELRAVAMVSSSDVWAVGISTS